MNKKYLAFILMGVFMMAFAAAGLVNYLGETVETEIGVTGPLELTVEEFEMPHNFGLQTVDFTLQNTAVVPVYTIVETSITGDSEDSRFSSENVGEEFTTLRIGIIIAGVETQELCESVTGDHFEDGYCYWDASYDRSFTGVEDGVYYVQMGDGNVPIDAGETMQGRMQLQFNVEVEPAIYTFATKPATIDGAKDLTNLV